MIQLRCRSPLLGRGEGGREIPVNFHEQSDDEDIKDPDRALQQIVDCLYVLALVLCFLQSKCSLPRDQSYYSKRFAYTKTRDSDTKSWYILL